MRLVDSIKKDFTTVTWVLIPVAIALNIVVGQIVAVLKLPIFLDMIGTVLVGVLSGPWAGALTGTLSNVIWGLLIDPNYLPWFPVALVIGLLAGVLARHGYFKAWWRVIIAGIFIALAAAAMSAIISVYLYAGITASGISFVTAFLLQSGRSLWEAVLAANFIFEPVDKIATALLAYLIIRGLSKRYLARFPRAENVAA